MELAGRVDPAKAKLVRFSAKRALYGSQGWEGHSRDEKEVLSLRSEKTGDGEATVGVQADGRFSRKRGLNPPKGGAEFTSVQ